MTQRPMTERQGQVLREVVRYRDACGYAPTMREIGCAFGITSTNAISDHLRALERNGYLTREGERARSIVVTEKGYAAAGSPREGHRDPVALRVACAALRANGYGEDVIAHTLGVSVGTVQATLGTPLGLAKCGGGR